MSNIKPDLDLSLLHEIADGSNDFIIESIDMFLANTPNLLHGLSQALSSRDWTAVASTAHLLKSNVGFFGMPVSQALMQDIEIMAKAGQPDLKSVQLKFDEANELISANFKSLEKIKGELEVGS